MVVIITSTGGVSKMLATFERPLDPGSLTWAGEYLNERLVGFALGARMLSQRLVEPSLSPLELDFIERLVPAFGGLASEVGERRSTSRAPPACSPPARSRTPRR